MPVVTLASRRAWCNIAHMVTFLLWLLLFVLCWPLAFVAVQGSPLWLIPAATAIFARVVYIGYEADGVWLEPAWAAWAVWGPFLLAWVGYWVWKRRKARCERREAKGEM